MKDPTANDTGAPGFVCLPKAPVALNSAVGAGNTQVVNVPGGYVDAVVGGKASQKLFPRCIRWMKERTCN